MAFISGGDLLVLRPADGSGSAARIHVSPFYLDKYEVTQAQWRVFQRSTSWTSPIASPADDKLPITPVTLEAARAYCNWVHARLPSEAEWEWAATGGADDAVYPWGTVPDLGRMNVAEGINDKKKQSLELVHVGSYPPTVGGLYDLCGNAAEWCELVPALVARERGDFAKFQVEAILRGGCAFLGPRAATTYNRIKILNGTTMPGCGLRCAHSLPSDESN